MRKNDPTRIIDTACTRNSLTHARMCYLADVPLSTFNYHRAKGNYPLIMLRRLSRVIHFTDEECKELINGVH